MPRQAAIASPLLAWLDEPRADAGLHFSTGDGGWHRYSYPDFAHSVREAAAWIDAAADGPGEVVALVFPSGPSFVAALLGTLLAGRTPCPLAPPGGLLPPDEYRDHAARILQVAQPSLVVSDPGLEPVVAEAATQAGLAHRVRTLALQGDRVEPPVRPGAELALLQFTSGSSGSPRGVRVTPRNLEANVRMIHTWMGVEPHDECATWLPLFHDMGLIGCLLAPVATQNTVWIMRPEEFIGAPERWLARFGRGSATVGVAPGFAFGYARKRVPPEAWEGMDFTRWRTALVAAERIDPGELLRFAKLAKPHGFRAEAFLPAYGLAEGTLAVTGGTLDAAASLVRVDWDRLALGRPVNVIDRASMALGDADRVTKVPGWLASCGRAHPGLDVEILDEDGMLISERRLGEIRVVGETVAAGYQGVDEVASTQFTSGGLRTGDAGFLLNGELYVVGRIGDSLKVRGRSVYMEDVEDKLWALHGIRKGRCVAIAGNTNEGQILVAVVEGEAGPWVDDAADVLRRAVGSEHPVQIRVGGPGVIRRTSSGKPRRRAMWRALTEGRLPAELIHSWRPVERPSGPDPDPVDELSPQRVGLR